MNSPSEVKLSQIDTTGYDFGGTMSQAEIDEELDQMDNDPEFAMDEDKDEDE